MPRHLNDAGCQFENGDSLPQKYVYAMAVSSQMRPIQINHALYRHHFLNWYSNISTLTDHCAIHSDSYNHYCATHHSDSLIAKYLAYIYTLVRGAAGGGRRAAGVAGLFFFFCYKT